MEDVLGVYARDLDDDTVLICLDETSRQQTKETRTPLPTLPGKPAGHDFEYERNGTAILFMLYAPPPAWRHVEVTDRRTRQDFARVLNKQGRRTARGLPFTRDLVCELRRSRGIPAHADREGQDDGAALGVADAARDLGVNEATLYRWIRAGLVPVIDPGVDGAPFRVRMTEELRARFRPQAPEGFVPVQVAVQRLGVSRQTIWNRVRSGNLASCHVTHGSRRGLYVEMPEEGTLPLFETSSGGQQT